MKKYFRFLNEGHGPKDQVCHKTLFKVIVTIVTGKIIRIVFLKDLVVIIIGNNLKKVGINLSEVGSNLSKVGNNSNNGLTNPISRP